jgi:hypothetical protein
VAIKHTKQISMKQKENTESLGVNIWRWKQKQEVMPRIICVINIRPWEVMGRCALLIEFADSM